MKILIWSPNYAPELIGISPLVTEAAEWLASRGHEVDVVTALPNYPARAIFPGYRRSVWRTNCENSVRVHRSWLRVRPHERFVDKSLYEASFAAFSAPRGLRRARRADVMVCVVPTLLSAGIGALATRVTRTPLVLWVQDLVLAAAQSIDDLGAARHRALRGLRAVESLAVRSAARIVTCSEGFIPYLIARGAYAEQIETIPNWVSVDRFPEVSEPGQNGSVHFLYTGNIGYTQGFETLFDAAALVGEGITVNVVGGGNDVEHVRRLARRPLRIRPEVPRDEYPALLSSAHALVVLQREVAANANLPSKIASYLASGRPIVASIGLDTPAAAVLRASGGSIIVPPEDPIALAGAMQRLRDDPNLRSRLGARGRAYAVEHLALERVLPCLEKVLLDPSRETHQSLDEASVDEDAFVVEEGLVSREQR